MLLTPRGSPLRLKGANNAAPHRALARMQKQGVDERPALSSHGGEQAHTIRYRRLVEIRWEKRVIWRTSR